MKKTYTYDEKIYKRKVKFTGAYCGVLALLAIVYFFFGSRNYLLIAVAAIGAYTYWETYGSLSNPGKVEIDEKGITFSGCGMVNSYEWKDIYSFRVKEFIGARKIFLRINEASLKKGRYWINCMYFNDTDELFNFFRDKEYEIHPDSIKSQARRSTEKKFEKRQAELAEKKEEERIKNEEKAKLKAEKKAAKDKAKE